LQPDLLENIIYSANIPENILEKIDNLSGDIVMGDPISGAKKIIPWLNESKSWITKETYKQTGQEIIQQKCYN